MGDKEQRRQGTVDCRQWLDQVRQEETGNKEQRRKTGDIGLYLVKERENWTEEQVT